MVTRKKRQRAERTLALNGQSSNKTSRSSRGTPTSSSPPVPPSTHSFVGLLLAGVLRSFARVAADLHVHGVDDVEEILHHGHALEGRVHGRDTVHTLRTQAERAVSRPRRRPERGNTGENSQTRCSLEEQLSANIQT